MQMLDAVSQPYTRGTPLNIPGDLPIYATSTDVTKADDACDPLPDDTPDLSEFLVVIHRGTCPFVRNFIDDHESFSEKCEYTGSKVGQCCCERREIFLNLQVCRLSTAEGALPECYVFDSYSTDTAAFSSITTGKYIAALISANDGKFVSA
jgi:hypothetical protein